MVRPCNFFTPTPEGHVLEHQPCGWPVTHRLTYMGTGHNDNIAVWHLDACTRHFLAAYVLSRILGNYLEFTCLHDKESHRTP